MTTQAFKSLCSFTLAATVFAVRPVPVSADQPDGVLRWFVEVTDNATPCMDWEADGSRRIVAHADGNDPVIEQFATATGGIYPGQVELRDDDGNLILDLEGTTWIRMPVIHISDSGAEQVRDVFWLQELESDPPRPGITSETGPAGNVLLITSFGVERLDATWGSNSGKLVISSGAVTRFCLSLGEFSK